MGALAQTVLPFKLAATEEMLTANAGLALFGELMRGLGPEHRVTSPILHNLFQAASGQGKCRPARKYRILVLFAY
jgi:hypothetical protein